MDILLSVVNSVITGLSVFIASYALFSWQKKALLRDIEAWLNSDRGREALKGIGKLITSGGMQQIVSKPPKLQDMLGYIALGYAQKSGMISAMPQPEPQT